MNEVITIGLDLAKNVFQVHGVGDAGAVMIGKRLRRRQVIPFFKKLPSCLIGVEACATSHHWARKLAALGHEVRIMPATYVKPSAYVRGRSDGGHGEGERLPNRSAGRTWAGLPPVLVPVVMLVRARFL